MGSIDINKANELVKLNKTEEEIGRWIETLTEAKKRVTEAKELCKTKINIPEQ